MPAMDNTLGAMLIGGICTSVYRAPFMMLAWRNSLFSKAIRYHDYAVDKLLSTVAKWLLHFEDCGELLFIALFHRSQINTTPQIGVLWYGAWCPLPVSLSVISLFRLFDTVHLALVSQGLYHFMFTNYAKPETILRPAWSVPHYHRNRFLNVDTFAWILIACAQESTCKPSHEQLKHIFIHTNHQSDHAHHNSQ